MWFGFQDLDESYQGHFVLRRTIFIAMVPVNPNDSRASSFSNIVDTQGLYKVAGLIAIVMNDKDVRIGIIARQALKMILGQINELQMPIAALDASQIAAASATSVLFRLT